MAEKVTVMVLKVDLQCPYCYKKVKKILCKFPQIRDQTYNDKANTVTITVVCCNPEKFRDKLCCKGAKVIKSIEIVEPKPPKPPPPKPPPAPAPAPAPPPPAPAPAPPPPAPAPRPPPPAPAPPPPQPCPVPAFPVPVKTCCGPCSGGCGGWPCHHGCGVRPPPCHGWCCCGYCHDKPCHVSRCDYYFSEENPRACSIM